ncbi:MAG TPA: hypothetical protein VFB97_03900 [Bacteroidales bacterium]|nr:hypothetical protein [Bacteroidales bacterium]
MQIKHFIGIDVSKDTLDLSVVVDGKNIQYYREGRWDVKKAIQNLHDFILS